MSEAEKAVAVTTFCRACGGASGGIAPKGWPACGCRDQRLPLTLWRFDDAPEAYRELSEHGGDEDWLALIPAHMAEEWFPWMETGSWMGCSSVSEHPLPDGSIIRIGAHA